MVIVTGKSGLFKAVINIAESKMDLCFLALISIGCSLLSSRAAAEMVGLNLI